MKTIYIILALLLQANILFGQQDQSSSVYQEKESETACSNLTHDSKKSLNEKWNLGFELDALPFISNGYYGSLWLGLNEYNIRIRPVYAKVNIPEFVRKDFLSRNTLSVYAIICDYFFQPDFKGLWIGAGMEYWNGELEDKSFNTSEYTELIFTIGGGYVYKVYDNLYINPWVAGHLHCGGDTKVKIGTESFSPATFTPEISIKLGWHF